MTGRQVTVLFVEDEIFLLSEFKRILGRRGYLVLATSHPQEVLQLIRREDRIDFMVTDLQLPMEGVKDIGLQEAAGGKRAGIVLAREVRLKFRRVPIVFWSGSYDHETRSEIVTLGNAHLRT